MTGRPVRPPAQTPRISQLREVRGGRVEVELDDAPWRTLPVDVVVRAGVSVGRELDRPTARDLARELRRSRALTRASRALAHRDLPAEAVDARLAQAGFGTEVRAEAVEALQRAGLVDDGRFAVGRAAALAARGYGDEAIRADLERQGVDGDLTEGALACLEPEAERAERIAAKRGRSPATARYLAARGFDAEAVEAAVGGVVAGDP
jgi:SOS response regulatory protein OraA/RecX